MPFDPDYHEEEPSREELGRMEGPVLVEFGAGWCPICRGFEPEVKRLLGEHSDIAHVRVADGRGKPLGRSFRVTLWPTFVLLRDGQVAGQLVRPDSDELRDGLRGITSAE